MKLQTIFIKQTLALLLTVLLVMHGRMIWSDTSLDDSRSLEDNFTAALKDYQKGSYKQAAAALEPVLNRIKAKKPKLKAKIYLLLGACYESSGESEKAKEYYLLLQKIRGHEISIQIPVVPGIDTKTLTLFREIFEEKTFFNFKEPTPVSEIMKNNVVHAPRKSIEAKQKEQKRKKFPWLIAVGVVMAAGIAAVLLLTQKSGKKELIPLEITWIKIPAGEFLMGDNFREGDADELPVHKVFLDEYYISKYEITFKEYDIFCEDTGREKIKRNGPSPNYPVNNVSWNDATAFCNWLSQTTEGKITLPTEAQWEKAARGDYQYRYPWGNADPDCIKARYWQCVISISYQRADVGTRPTGVSPFQIHDMAGNAAEWCLDIYDASYYSVSPVNNPGGPGSGSFHVIRGGSYKSDIINIRSANRDFNTPEYAAEEIGFRIVKAPQSK
jgi:formylglycine-generating enzyme required for sulfatase activity